MLSPVGCGVSRTAASAEVFTRTCTEMPDGTWQYNGNTYKYRLIISGTMPGTDETATFVYLSNIKEITLGQAWKAAGFGSSTEDYFAVEDAAAVAFEVTAE